MASFKIGREFFAKAKADYADWHWSWIREISQNCMDCGSSRINVTIERKGENTQDLGQQRWPAHDLGHSGR